MQYSSAAFKLQQIALGGDKSCIFFDTVTYIASQQGAIRKILTITEE